MYRRVFTGFVPICMKTFVCLVYYSKLLPSELQQRSRLSVQPNLEYKEVKGLLVFVAHTFIFLQVFFKEIKYAPESGPN